MSNGDRLPRSTKMNLLPRILVALVLCCLPTGVDGVFASEQLETDDFHDVAVRATELAEKHGVENVLLVFDVDNTLLATNQDLGSDQWFGWQSKLLKEFPLPKEAVASEFTGLLRAYSLILSLSAMRPTQKELPIIVSGLQSQGFKILVLTSRGVDLRAATQRELVANGFRFDKSAMPPAIGFPGTFKPYCTDDIEASGLSREEAVAFLAKNANAYPVAIESSRSVSYSGGLFLTEGQHKGVMLRTLLNRSGRAYRSIVFVDDHIHNVDRVFAAFKDTDVEVVTYRYSAEDANVRRFLEGKKKSVTKDWMRLKRSVLRSFEIPRLPSKQCDSSVGAR